MIDPETRAKGTTITPRPNIIIPSIATIERDKIVVVNNSNNNIGKEIYKELGKK